MFVVNIKLNIKKVLLVIFIIVAIIAIFMEYKNNRSESVETSKPVEKYDYILNESNYTEILKLVHENIDSNINKTIKMYGFVFKMPDFKEDYFVCGMNTVANGEDNIAGFLCQSSDAKKLLDNEWIEITGIIIKGTYNTEMPVIKVGSIKKIGTPANTFVVQN